MNNPDEIWNNQLLWIFTLEYPNTTGDLQVIPKPECGITPCSPTAGNVLIFVFPGFVVRRLVQEEGSVLVCELPAIPGHADLF